MKDQRIIILICIIIFSNYQIGYSLNDSSSVSQNMVTVIPGEHYTAGEFHSLIFGEGYRQIWSTPVKVAVLNLDTFARRLNPYASRRWFTDKFPAFPEQ